MSSKVKVWLVVAIVAAIGIYWFNDYKEEKEKQEQQVACPYCYGSGAARMGMYQIECPICNGNGIMSKSDAEQAARDIANLEGQMQQAGYIDAGGYQPSTGNSGNIGSSNRKQCPFCNGAGTTIYDPQMSHYGLERPTQERCRTCGQMVDPSHHKHITCSKCGGSGYIDY